MPTYLNWVKDSDGDGIADDVVARLLAMPPADGETREFWTAMLRLTERIGQATGALPLPLVVTKTADIPNETETVVVGSVDDLRILGLEAQDHRQPADDSPVSTCLTRLFTIDGALVDEDGDLLPDSTRIDFDLPGDLEPSLGAALANLAARIGLETRNAELSLAGATGANFTVRPGAGPAAVISTGSGWLATGDTDDLARLLDRMSQSWPHVSIPESGGAAFSIGVLRRWLAGDGPETQVVEASGWELQWTAPWEVDRIENAFREQVMPTLDPAEPVNVTIFASESLEIRQALTHRIESELSSHGFSDVRVQVLCTFKAGLSWLREVVITGLAGQAVKRIVIAFQRHEPGPDALDRPTRWLQECFPGDEILARDLGIPLDAIEFVERADDGSTFSATAFAADDSIIGIWEVQLLASEWPFVSAIPGSGTVTVTTSGIIAERNSGRLEIPVASDLELFWLFWQDDVLPRVLELVESRGALAVHQPFFARLEADVTISEPNSRLGIREENDSAAEALHEDIYFNTLDAIEMFGERTSSDKLSAPGAVVPIVRVMDGESPSATVRFREAPEPSTLPYPDLTVRELFLQDDEFVLGITVEYPEPMTVKRLLELAGLPRPAGTSIPARVTAADVVVDLRLPLQQVIQPANPLVEAPTMHENIQGEDVLDLASRLAAMPEVTAWIEDHSFEARPIPVLSLAPPTPGRLRSPLKMSILKPTALIIARHHANEISSTNAAFNLAWRCANQPEWRTLLDKVNIVIIPYENPDGAALHARLISDPAARNWKHHPARYNALGFEFSQDMFNPDTRFGESRVRPALWHRFLPDAIVDNHGVPSHEWVQPFAGFGSPPRFPVSYWIPQALLYGIVSYVESEEYPEHLRMTNALRDAVSAIVRDTDIGDLNRAIGRSYRFWGQERDPERFPGEFHDDMLWHIHGRPPDPEGRGFSTRFPKSTVLNWVTEVIDETADGDHLEVTARAHLLANRAMLDLLAAAAGNRKRPLDVG